MPRSNTSDLMRVKFSTSLTDAQAAFARSLVDKGRYSSVSVVTEQVGGGPAFSGDVAR